MPGKDQKGTVLAACLCNELSSLLRDVDETRALRLHRKRRRRDDFSRNTRNRRQGNCHGAQGETGYVFLRRSFCRVPTISTRRRQTFSKKLITLLRSVSFGSCSRGSPGVAGPPGLTVPGSGRLRASSSFFSATFSACRRPISASSAVRSSGSARQAQPTD